MTEKTEEREREKVVSWGLTASVEGVQKEWGHVARMRDRADEMAEQDWWRGGSPRHRRHETAGLVGNVGDLAVHIPCPLN